MQNSTLKTAWKLYKTDTAENVARISSVKASERMNFKMKVNILQRHWPIRDFLYLAIRLSKFDQLGREFQRLTSLFRCFVAFI